MEARIPTPKTITSFLQSHKGTRILTKGGEITFIFTCNFDTPVMRCGRWMWRECFLSQSDLDAFWPKTSVRLTVQCPLYVPIYLTKSHLEARRVAGWMHRARCELAQDKFHPALASVGREKGERRIVAGIILQRTCSEPAGPSAEGRQKDSCIRTQVQ